MVEADCSTFISFCVVTVGVSRCDYGVTTAICDSVEVVCSSDCTVFEYSESRADDFVVSVV